MVHFRLMTIVDMERILTDISISQQSHDGKETQLILKDIARRKGWLNKRRVLGKSPCNLHLSVCSSIYLIPSNDFVNISSACN